MSGPWTAGAQSAQPLIVAAELAKPDFAWLDAMRRQHYPPDRNRVAAHLTMFRTLPPSAEEEVRRSLARAAGCEPPPRAEIAGPMDLDTGVALRIESADLSRIREELAAEFHGLLTAQDMGRWTPHVTIQNKAEPREVRRLMGKLRTNFEPRPLGIAGLQLVRYLDGTWKPLASYRFRGA